MMSHQTADSSLDNHFAAWLIFGEGFQSNHHAYLLPRAWSEAAVTGEAVPVMAESLAAEARS